MSLQTLSQLQTAVQTKLNGSGIKPAYARQLRIVPLLPAVMRQLCPGLPVYRAGFQIPYFSLQGRPVQFYRVRYLDYGNSAGFSALVTAVNPDALRPLRYGQPAATLNEIYIPPVAGIPWTKLAADPAIPVTITEGELKAACATLHGLPTIGLGGVWCFMSKQHNLPLLPQFDLFKWEGRPVNIIFDSDAQSNPEVQMAQNTLARRLTQRGAAPRICQLPGLPGIKKTGLDDFIMHHNSTASVEQLIKDTPLFREAEELHRLNEEVVYVRDPGLILQLASGQRMTARAFQEHAYSDRVYVEKTTSQTKDGGEATRLTEKCAPREWIKWPPRACVTRIAYKPGRPRYLEEDNSLNAWKGWGTVPVEGNVQPWHGLLDCLFGVATRPAGSNPDSNSTRPASRRDAAATADALRTRRWFEQWLAYPLQHPGTKLYTAVVLWGIRHGTGKSLIGYSMFKIYGENAAEISDRDLTSTHNEWAENRQFVMGEEITGGDKRNVADHMKGMITQQRLRVNPKYIPAYTVDDAINYYFTSNHPDAFFLEDNDRRFFIHEVAAEPQPVEFYKEYAHWLHNGGAARLFHYLLTLPLDDFEPAAPAPATLSKSDMIGLGKSDLANWVSRLREEPDSVLRLGNRVLPYTLFTTDQLLRLYDPDDRKKVTVNGVARELKRSGFHKVNMGNPVTTIHGLLRLWAVRVTPEEMAQPTNMRTLMLAEAGELSDIYNAEYAPLQPKFAGVIQTPRTHRPPTALQTSKVSQTTQTNGHAPIVPTVKNGVFKDKRGPHPDVPPRTYRAYKPRPKEQP